MIEIRSREEASARFGMHGGPAWDRFIDSGYEDSSVRLFDCTFYRPKPLEPLTDTELTEAYNRGPNVTFRHALRAVVTAHDARLAEIEASK